MDLTPDEIDDVLYLTRVDERDELLAFINELAQKYSTTSAAVLESSIDPESHNNAIHFCAANGLTALLQALLQVLHDAHQPSPLINSRNESGNAPLHWAALNGHLETAKLLIAAGADIWARNMAGNLAIFEAERAGKDDVVAYLLEVGGTEKEQADGSAGTQNDSVGPEQDGEDVPMGNGHAEEVNEAFGSGEVTERLQESTLDE